ncbi:MAG TPA: hypothetical protein VEI06_01400 [Gemmatimonadaceae bacterium]|nr:hypothetical protein [Gemmatimonadaceae bacterium]
MSTPIEHPPRAINTGDVKAQPPLSQRVGSKIARWALYLVLLFIVLAALYTFFTLTYSYSKGERAGYLQRFAKTGWVCKTWEGEIAMATLPGTIPQFFRFTVRNDSIANLLTSNIGKFLSVSYEEHRGIPTSCFGETSYFVRGVSSAPPPPPTPAAPQ